MWQPYASVEALKQYTVSCVWFGTINAVTFVTYRIKRLNIVSVFQVGITFEFIFFN